jgi:hypothetical protein
MPGIDTVMKKKLSAPKRICLKKADEIRASRREICYIRLLYMDYIWEIIRITINLKVKGRLGNHWAKQVSPTGEKSVRPAGDQWGRRS